jgi:organic radical activating enzyme
MRKILMEQTPIPTEQAVRSQSRGGYRVNEIFFSVQGEGRLAGTPMVFIRFSDCNLRCSVVNAGFDCDTEFLSGRYRDIDDILADAEALNPRKGWLLFTGGEPALQLDAPLVTTAKRRGWRLAIETNGTIKLPEGLDWICVSPKTAEHTLRQRTADEVKYVRQVGMEIPEPTIKATHHLISPPFMPNGFMRLEDLEWCIELVKANPEKWSLSFQYHKLLQVR